MSTKPHPLGVDYAFGRMPGRALCAAGFSFACRYLSHSLDKNLSAAEAAELHAAGVAIVLVWEDGAQNALGGRAQGEIDARAALAQADELHAPADVPIYFAVDFDPAASELGTIAEYFQGVRSVLGFNRTGVYGGYPVCAELHHLHARYAWQTYAWSSGRVWPAANLYQFSNGHMIAGVSVDFDRALHDAYGQWAPPARETRKAPHGLARFAGSVDLERGDWKVHGSPTLHRPTFGVGGTGAWEIEPLPAEGGWWCAKVKVHRGA